MQRIFSELNLDSTGTFVEFGWRGLFGANTHALSVRGWKGVRFDGGNVDPNNNVYSEFITAGNIVQVFKRHEVPLNVTYVSIDVDSTDIWLMRALLASEYKPLVLTIEYNSNYPWNAPLAFPPSSVHAWDGACFMGSSAAAILSAAESLGYLGVDLEPGLDLFLVRADVWGKRHVPDFSKLPYLHRLINMNYKAHESMSDTHATQLIDYSEYANSGGDLGRSRDRARDVVHNLRKEGNLCFVGRRHGCKTHHVFPLYSKLCRDYDADQWLPLGAFPLGVRTFSAWNRSDYAKLIDGTWKNDTSCRGIFCDPELTNVSLHSTAGQRPPSSQTRRCCTELARSRDVSCPQRENGICRRKLYRSAWHGWY